MLTFSSRLEARRASTAALVNCRPMITRAGVKPNKRPIRCGVQGCVYRAGKGRVFKATIDESELHLAYWLKQLQEHGNKPSMLPEVYGAWKPGGCSPMGAIYREDLVDVKGTAEWRALRRAFSNVRGTVAFAGRNIYFRYGTGRVQRKQLEREAAAFECDSAADSYCDLARRWYAQGIEMLRWMTEHEVGLGDLHEGNWGMRVAPGQQFGDLVVRDLGFAELPRGAGRAIPALMGLGRARSRVALVPLRGV